MGAEVGKLMSYGFTESWPKKQSSLHVLRHMLLWPSFPLYVKTFCKLFVLSQTMFVWKLGSETTQKASAYLIAVINNVSDIDSEYVYCYFR